MTKHIPSWCMLAIFMPLLMVSCSRSNSNNKSATSDWKMEVQKWEQEGWQQEEILGAEGDFALTSFMKSDTARSLTAFWVTKGVQAQKQYVQNEKKYLILTFSKADGDSFAVVLFKTGRP